VNLRQKRQRANQLTSKIIQSVFLKMFGDPVKNPKRWETRKLGQLATRITKGESPKWQGFEYVAEGPLFIRSENVQWGSLDLSNQARIPVKFHQKLKRSVLQPNDVLINLVGASIGRAAMVPDAVKEANVNQAVGVISLAEILKPEYLVQLLIFPSVQKLIQKEKVEAARANISLTDLRHLTVPVPPVRLQDRFAEFCRKSETIRDRQNDSLTEINELFHSLMHKAFRGELAA
jgi:type I restriction enzyme S subunit